MVDLEVTALSERLLGLEVSLIRDRYWTLLNGQDERTGANVDSKFERRKGLERRGSSETKGGSSRGSTWKKTYRQNGKWEGDLGNG